jgi:hypothetical protein
MYPLVWPPHVRKWDLGHHGWGAFVGGGLADSALADVLLNCFIHVGPPVVLFDPFHHLEDPHVACDLGVMSLLNHSLGHGQGVGQQHTVKVLPENLSG